MGKKDKYKRLNKNSSKQFGRKSFKGNKNGKNNHSNKKSNFKNPKKKRAFEANNEENSKKFKSSKDSMPPPQIVPPEESSESEEEQIDYTKLLRESFGDQIKTINNTALSSESSSDEDEELDDNSTKKTNEELILTDEESSSEAESDEESTEEILENLKDPFNSHVSYELHPNLLETLQSDRISFEIHKKSWTKLGDLSIEIPKCEINEAKKQTLLDTTIYAVPASIPKKINSNQSTEELFIKSQIAENISAANKSVINKETLFTPLQQEFFSILNNYQDFYYPQRTFDNAEEIRFIYCLHAINHVLKTRVKILHHNAKLTKKDDVPEEYRDQGLVRPKVLIIVPFKDAALKIITNFENILFKEDKGNVMKKSRFTEDYGTGHNTLHFPKKNPKPEDYEKTFCGNTSDDFKIGLSITKKNLKLYSDFYTSDIIVASPLGLRTIIGAPGETERDFDFLTSIELLILDQTDIFLMQNWFHILHVFEHLHLKPKDLHGTDVSRVRQWCLNLWSKYYRQTLIISSVTAPFIEALFTKQCTNFAGKIKSLQRIENAGEINHVYVQMQHIFQKFNCISAVDMVEKRFDFFVQKILPLHRDPAMKQTLIFIPSYYDYVKVRNYFKKEDLNFVQICEYSKEGKIARARDMFYHGDAHFLLYTERYHFYHRIRVKGIRHLIFYQLPTYPAFYSELSNLMQLYNMNKKCGSNDNMSITVIYTKFDHFHLASLVGTERCVRMISSDQDVHMLLTTQE